MPQLQTPFSYRLLMSIPVTQTLLETVTETTAGSIETLILTCMYLNCKLRTMGPIFSFSYAGTDPKQRP